MVKVYATSLVIGVIILIGIIFGAAFNAKSEPATAWRRNDRLKMATGALIGFGMGGMSAEFSPLDLTWPVSLAIAAVAAILSAYWVRYAIGLARTP